MRLTYSRIRALCLSAALTLLAVPIARAAYTIDITQVGSNVVATGAGSIDTTGLTASVAGISPGSITVPNAAYIILGPTTTTFFTEFISPTGPASFGPGATSLFPSFGSGHQVVGIVGQNNILVLPRNYISGSDLGTSIDAWDNQTFASMGLSVGTYTYTWGTASHADTFTVQIIPEPASLSLIALIGLALQRRR